MPHNALAASDLLHHVVKFGIDIYPPIEIESERTRLHMFYEEARNRWGELYEVIVAGEAEFKISKVFAQRPGKSPSIPVETFVLTPRGPVFVFPVLLPPPVGSTGLEGRVVNLFHEVRDLLFGALAAKREYLRVGMIRDLLFDTGQTRCEPLIAKGAGFAGAELVGGKQLHVFRDAKCNLRIELEPVEITKTTRLPVGANIAQHTGYGVRVVLDVNNAEFRPLNDADIRDILERASSLWPGELLRYINERSEP